MISKELQIGKAAEHFVCTDLIIKGYNAFLTDQGLPYDVVLDFNNKLYKIQVKGSMGFSNFSSTKYATGAAQGIYRFGMRRGKNVNSRRLVSTDVDIMAFVALDRLKVGYLCVTELTNKNGIKFLVEFKTKEYDYEGRTYCNGNKRNAYGKFIEDYSDISRVL